MSHETSKKPRVLSASGIHIWEGELLMSTWKHFAHVFFSFASVVRHFPSCVPDFSHSTFEISTWGLATWWTALRFPAYAQGQLQLWHLWYLFVFLSLAFLLPSQACFAFILSQYFTLVMSEPFFSTVLSSGKHSIVSAAWFLTLTLLLPSCDCCSLNHSAPRAWAIFLKFCWFLCSDIVADVVCNSANFASLFCFLDAGSSLSL